MVPHAICCLSPPFLTRGLLPRNGADFEIRNHERLLGLAIARDGAYDIYVVGQYDVPCVVQHIAENNILAEILNMVKGLA